jgi:hypothetical protein
MPWNVAATGEARSLKAEIAKQFEEAIECKEPEESIRLAAREAIFEVLDGQDSDTIVKVSAHGSMMYNAGKLSNSLSITIDTIHV